MAVMNTLDDAVKTFLMWKGVGHIIMIGYAFIAGFIVWDGYHLGDKLTTQQTFVISTLIGVLPVMLNWYSGVMAMTRRETE